MNEDEQQVRQANESFYRAFEALDLEAMQRVWARGNHIQCGHPGWSILRGRERVLESWRRIFENTPSIQFMLTDITIQIRGDLAWVTLYENITSTVEAQKVTATVLTTNIFEKGSEGWRMVHHHGSSVGQPPPQSDPTVVH